MSKKRIVAYILFVLLIVLAITTIGYKATLRLQSKQVVSDVQKAAYSGISASKEESSDKLIADATNAQGITETTKVQITTDATQAQLTTDSTKVSATTDSTESDSSTLVSYESPIDFNSLQISNEDIYAWISIPDTSIDYPIAQHPTDDSYYLNHGADGFYSDYGCPYTELSDSKSFTEFNTIIYGHNMNDGSMFGALHSYEDETFFDEHRTIYIYTKDHVFTYKIFAAVMYSDAHIPYFYDDNIEADREAFLDSLKTDIVKERSIYYEDTDVTSDSKILTLSTCDKKLRNNRFLIVAVMTEMDGLTIAND